MRKTMLPVALLIAAAMAPGAAAAASHPSQPTAPGKPAAGPHDGYVPGELIVKFKPGLAPAQRTDALHDRGARLERSLSIPGTALVRVPAGTAVRDAIAALERDPRVARAEPNAYRHGMAMPNDPGLPQLWGLDNTGQTVNGEAGTADADIDAPEAWARTTGSADVKVAVLDSGIAFGQPDLAPNIWHNPGESGAGRESNGVDDDGNGYVDDWRGWDFVGRDNEPSDNYGHGTHVAGTIAARGNDGVGVTGVAWRASIVPVRVLDNDNASSCVDAAEGIAYAVRAGARVVNMSLGGGNPCEVEREAIERAPNTLFVISAGNAGEDTDQSPSYPCVFPSANVVCVAATDSADRLTDWSNYGAQSVDLAAPGSSILSTIVKFGPVETIYGTGFETALDSAWDTGGSPNTWQRTSQNWRRSGGYSLSNSLLGWYVNGTDNWARLSLDLTNERDCYANVWRRFSLGPIDRTKPLEGHDRILAETSTDRIDWSHNWLGMIGANAAFDQWSIELSQLEGRSTGGLRFHFLATAQDTYLGVALDDLVVYCIPPVTSYSGARDEYEFYDGTSMAAPHVSGVAALMLSLDSTLTSGELKQQLLGTVDKLPGLAGRTVTGGRLNAARAVNLPPRPSANGLGAGPPPAPPASLRSRMASALAADLKAIAEPLRSLRIRRLLRRRGLAPVRLHALTAGRFTLELKSASGKTIAAGTCSRRRAGRCTLTARLTSRGRSLLRGARRQKVTLELAFKPRSGRALVRSTALTLR